MRSLEDMKRARGGCCVQCGKDIMDPSEKDHTFCNQCWWTNLHHKFYIDPLYDSGGLCDRCGEPEQDEDGLHADHYEAPTI